MVKNMKVLAWPAFSYEPFNPYNRLLNENLLKQGAEIIPYSHSKIFSSKFDVWHLHWPAENVIRKEIFKTIFRLIAFGILILVTKLKGSKIIWTAHNQELHESYFPKLESVFWKIFIPSIDAFICHSKNARKILLEAHPKLTEKKNEVIYHGNYKTWYKNEVSDKKARRVLNIDIKDFVLLFVGTMRPYKNISELISCFNELEIENIKLVLAGKCTDDKIQEFIQSYSDENPKIIFHNKWLKDDEFQYYFNSSNLVVLPYRIMNSGMSLLSLSFHKPILMPKNPMLVEYSSLFKKNYLNLYDQPLTKQHILDTIQLVNNLNTNEKNGIDNLSWDLIAKQTYNFYKKVLKD